SKVSVLLGSRSAIRRVKSRDLQERIESLPRHYDEPFPSESCLPSLILSEFARKDVKVALAGDGGDELFMGYGHYNWMKRTQLFSAISHRWLNFMLSKALHLGSEKFQRAGRLVEKAYSLDHWPEIWGLSQHLF